MNETVLSLKNIKVTLGSERVLDSVSVDVREGEALGVSGRNGAGKSTLVKIMAGTLKPDSGTRELSESAAGRICFVPQEIALYPTLTGRQNLEFWAEAYGVTGRRKRERIDFLLELMGLMNKAGKRLETYSGGMQRRLNMAAALVVEPKLLLLDEPTVGADEDSAAVMLDTVKGLRDRGTAVVMISHITEDLSGVCDRVLTLEGGRLK